MTNDEIADALTAARRDALTQAADIAGQAIRAYLASQRTEDEAGYPPFHLALLEKQYRALAAESRP